MSFLPLYVCIHVYDMYVNKCQSICEESSEIYRLIRYVFLIR